jgi:hypothetical protein
MTRSFAAAAILIGLLSGAHAASHKQPPPPGAFRGAPAQYTQFTTRELERGFFALAFGSDLRIGTRPLGIRRFDHPIHVAIVGGGADRSTTMKRVIEDYAHQVPSLQLSVASAGEPADIEVRLINQRDFRPALRATFGTQVTAALLARLNPQCITKIESTAEGQIIRAVSFVIVDKGEREFLDCAYHELLHAFGLSNHDQRNPWTTLNQHRVVGYLTVYDRSLLAILYDRRVRPGMAAGVADKVLPGVIGDLGLTAPGRPK